MIAYITHAVDEIIGSPSAKHFLVIVANRFIEPLSQSFPRLGSLRGCGRAHVLVVRPCKHLASVHPRVEKSARMKGVHKCYRDATALPIKHLNWDYPPCAGFKKRYLGRTVTCLKNAIGSLCPICDPNPYYQKGYFKKKRPKK